MAVIAKLEDSCVAYVTNVSMLENELPEPGIDRMSAPRNVITKVAHAFLYIKHFL